MKLQATIIEFISANPDKTSTEISTALGIAASKVKVVLCKLAKSGKVVRTKKDSEIKKAGPKGQYIYKVAE